MNSQTQIDNIANISWENGRYNFKDVPLAQLIQIVSQMYHTDILLQGVRKDESSFSGSIHYNEPLDKVLNKICFSLNLNIRQTWTGSFYTSPFLLTICLIKLIKA